MCSRRPGQGGCCDVRLSLGERSGARRETRCSPQPAILRGRMPPDLDVGRANLLQAVPVQVQRRHGGASGGCLAKDRQPVARPRKVLVPVLRARMKQPALTPGDGIDSALAIPLAAVAREAAECEIVRCRFAPCSDRDDVLDREFDVLPCFGRMAVFAKALCAPLDQRAQLGGDPTPSVQGRRPGRSCCSARAG